MDIRNCTGCFKDGVASTSCAPASGCSALALCCLENPSGLFKVEKEVSHLEQFQWVPPSTRKARPLRPGNSPPAVYLQRQSDIATPRGWCLRWSQGWSFLGAPLQACWLQAGHVCHAVPNVPVGRGACTGQGCSAAYVWVGRRSQQMISCMFGFGFSLQEGETFLHSSAPAGKLTLLWLADARIGCICWYVLNLNPFDKSTSMKIFQESFLRSQIISSSQMNRIRVTFAGYYFFLLYYHQSENKAALLLLFLFSAI